MKILVTAAWKLRSNDVDGVAKLKTMVPDDYEFVIPKTGSKDELIELVKDVDVILCDRLSKEVVDAADNVKLIQKIGVGVDQIPFDAFKDREIYVANTGAAHPVSLAESAVALMLALAKRIVIRHNKLQEGVKDEGVSIELRGKTLGIIGLGNIGTEVAKRASAFDMKIVAIKRHPEEQRKEQLNLDFLGGPQDLDHLLKTSDFVVITVPLTPETRGLLKERELKMMKTSAFLVNIARGAIIEENALYRALTERWIAGAALDVWHTEHWWDPAWLAQQRGTKPPMLPIHTLDNVIATPHTAGSSDRQDKLDQVVEIIVENLSRITHGKEPIEKVDRVLRY